MDWREAEREYTDEVIGETNLARMFGDAAERHGDRPAQRYKGGIYDRSLAETALPEAPRGRYHPISYAEMQSIVHNLAAGFRDLGVEAGDRVGIFANTRMEWAQADFALLAAGGVVTTVYTSSSERQVRYLLGDPGASGVVVENGDLLERVLAVEDDLELEFVVVMDEFEGYDDREDVLSLGELHDRGAAAFDPDAYEEWVDSRDLDELASLIYTSGTTGQPKGVRLTHGNFRANVNQVRKRFGPRPDRSEDVPGIDADTRTVSYLPLAHVFERTGGHFVMFASGACVAYAESPDTLKEDFQEVHPTAATSVPRVYERIYEAIREQAESSSVGQRVFPWATDVGREYYEADRPGPLLRAKYALADRLVFSNVREALGGEIELLISGGGSLSPELGKLYHAMGLKMLEGYGLTETAPVVTANPPEDPKIGTVGPPVVDVDLEFDESAAPDLSDDDGEVGELLIAGPNVTDGYWNMEEATEESFTEDGYFRTGDIMERRPDGYLQFRERAKQIIVLSTGKNVAPGPIEDAFASNAFVEQCVVLGDEHKFVSALIVPNLDHVRKWAADEGIDLPDDRAAVCTHDRVRERIDREVQAVNEEFESYEQIKEFRLVPEEWTDDNDLLTPSMKKKRRNIQEYYAEEIESIYSG